MILSQILCKRSELCLWSDLHRFWHGTTNYYYLPVLNFPPIEKKHFEEYIDNGMSKKEMM